MSELPPPGDIALAFVIVGALFLVRFALAVRRIRVEAGAPSDRSLYADLGRAPQPGAFGAGSEPERRSAMRQFYVGAVFSALGILVALWVVVSGAVGLTP